MKAKTTAIIFAIIVLTSISLASMQYSADDVNEDGVEVLFDLGNGKTYWSSSDPSTYSEITESAATAAGIDCNIGSQVEIAGLDQKTVVKKDYGSDRQGLIWYDENEDQSTPYSPGDVTSSWILYYWDAVSLEWMPVVGYDLNDVCPYETIAWGFFPDQNITPTETPDHKSSWTMIRGDSASSGSQTSEGSSEDPAEVAWSKDYGSKNFVCSSVLVAGDRIFVISGGGDEIDDPLPEIHCYDKDTGDEIWGKTYPRGIGYETASAAIIGGHIYVPATNGSVYKINFDGQIMSTLKVPLTSAIALKGERYQTGAASMIYDSGVLYFGASNGMVYCCDLNLKVLWCYQTEGYIYYSTPTVFEDTLYIGPHDGYLYSLNRLTGSENGKTHVYTGDDGLVNSVVVVGNTIMVLYSDGMGMDTLYGGVAAYDQSLGLLWKKDTFGVVSTYSLPVDNGVIFASGKGLYKIDIYGNSKLLNSRLGTIKAPLTLVNDERIYAIQYDAEGYLFELDTDGNIIGQYAGMPSSSTSYAMSPIVVIDGWLYGGNDKGAVFAVQGQLPAPVPSGGSDNWYVYIILAALVIAALALLYYFMKKRGPSDDDGRSYIKRNKRRLLYVVLIGSIAVFVLFIISLSVGPSVNLSLGDTFSALISYLQKDGGYTFNEIIVGSERLPRVMAVFAVGVGLSIAGAMYQAIIRNPLVDPYIMGVSSGAGAAAIAVIAFNFTFFGLFSSDSLYAVPTAAIIGGLAAFFLTMFIAEKAGKSSVNYVLAGVVVGLAFGAIQTLLLSMSGDKIHDSMTWMFGSFANISWDNVGLVFIPALCLSFIPLLWAKEFNLVLLGEEQAKQMGLNVVMFNRLMLILASVLTSVCVAFVGIIGFVGLVVPHVCRMILGGDHRLVLPASIVLGGCMMMIADLLAKMLMVPQELPVGAITTIIGVPVFAYLLIKRGRMYDG